MCPQCLRNSFSLTSEPRISSGVNTTWQLVTRHQLQCQYECFVWVVRVPTQCRCL
jgi:hypothetical protein